MPHVMEGYLNSLEQHLLNLFMLWADVKKIVVQWLSFNMLS